MDMRLRRGRRSPSRMRASISQTLGLVREPLMPVAPRRQPRRISPSDISIERSARKNNVGAYREPERVVADDRYLDEYAEDRDDNDKERSDKTKVHGLYLPVQPKRSKTLSL